MIDMAWLADLKELVFAAIVYLEQQSPWLGVGAVMLLILAVAARIADLDEIIKAWKHRNDEEE